MIIPSKYPSKYQASDHTMYRAQAAGNYVQLCTIVTVSDPVTANFDQPYNFQLTKIDDVYKHCRPWTDCAG